MKQAILIFSAAFLLFSCSPGAPVGDAFAQGLADTLKKAFQLTPTTLLVTNAAGAPLQAEILIGTGLNDPFPDNLFQTDAKGEAIAPLSWQTELPVTVRAPGYVSITYLQQTPHAMTFKMRKAPMVQRTTLSGTTRGYPIKDKDNQIDFGLIMKAMSKSELLAFDINKVISPENDTFSVVGQDAQIPSNISLPKQKETYFLPITIEKNPYRLFLSEAGPQKILALRGRFPFKKVIDEMRNNKDFVDLINEFSLDGGTIQDINVTGTALTLNLDLSNFRFQSSVPVLVPVFAADEVVLGVVAQDMNGILMPTDVKKLDSGQSKNLKALDASQSYILKVLQKQSDAKATGTNSGDRLSVIFTKANNNSAGQFLNLIANPRVQGQQIFLEAPATVTDINPYATYLVLSELQDVVIGGKTTKMAVNRWEVYSPGWNSQIDLPLQPLSPAAGPLANSQWRWEASFFGGVDSFTDLGPDVIQKTTHVTRSSIDF